MKKIVLPFFICFLLAVFSCSTDDKSNPDEHLNHFHKSLPEERISYKRVKKDDLPNVAAVNEELTRIKDIIDPALIIDDEIILYAGYEGKHTLTFVTYRVDRNSDKIENIVLESRPDGKYNPYLFSYDLTLNELDNLDKLTPETIKSRSEVVPLVAGNGGGLENINCFEAVQHFVGRWECEAGYEHEPGHPRCTIGGSRWVMHPMGLTWVYVGCGDSGGGSGGNGGSSGGGGATGGGGSGGGGNTGGGWDDGGDGDGSGGPESGPGFNLTEGQTIATQPIVFLDFNQVQLNAFFAGLTPSQQQWALANTATYSDIIDYLTNENWSEESRQLAGDLIDFILQDHIEIDNNYQGDYIDFNDMDELDDYFSYEETDITTTSSSDFDQDKKVTVRTVKINPVVSLVIQLVITPNPNFEVDFENSNCDVDTLFPSNSWVQNSMIVTNSNYNNNPDFAEITITGYILRGISIGDMEIGVKSRKQIIIRVNKNTGSIVYAQVKNVN
ncbi:hypothetical protein [Flavobacterium coralii]|uniref:hypothetical protein n=1 Tax=Flavobacterium coralii TaxID=2838017 RepID=UPI000C37E60E|nr:hypothetical protein [Flavobacterium sp.]|tara:strand:- start:45584 stop:47080 length:1497 start_codon:yes stop_codon:yes gene_type:complete